MDKAILTPSELLAKRSWTRFLESLPIGELTWRISDYRDFISLRTTASILSNREGAVRTYSIYESKEDRTIYNISVKKK